MRLTRQIAVIGTSVVVFVACSDPADPGGSLQQLPRPFTAAEQKVAAASNEFAFDLLKQINVAQRDSNVFISPLSASMALGMAMNGADGTTWEAMRSTLRLGGASQAEVNDGYRSLIELLRGLDSNTDFRIANSVWYRLGFPFYASFLDESRTYFDARAEGLDFGDPATVTAINGWVKTATNDKIPSIIDAIRRDEVMFLINAIYFKGAWQLQFDRSRTRDLPFHALDGTSQNVPLMHLPETELLLAQTSEYDAVDLRYGNSAFTMTIVVPRQSTDVNAFAVSLSDERWAALVNSFTERKSQLYLPRFKLEWKRRLNDDLIALGMGVAFDDSRANFGRMAPISPSRNLFITRVIQKTFVEVNEEGTEAAAATAVGIGVTSAPPVIRVDRPFIFAIRERFSGTILFLGKIVKLPA